MTKLIIFDLDGTLIEGHMETWLCGVCEGSGIKPGTVVIPAGHGSGFNSLDPDPLDRGSYVPCAECRGKGRTFGAKKDYDIVRPLPGVSAGLSRLADDHTKIAIATNQGGVHCGFETEEQVWRKLGRVSHVFQGFYGAAVSMHVAFWHPNGDNGAAFSEAIPEWRTDRRKPGTGMIKAAILAHGADPEDTMFVGDLSTDKLAAEAAGIDFTWAHDFFGFDRNLG